MRILIAGDREQERTRLAAPIRTAQRTIVDATLGNAASEIRRQTPDVLLVVLPETGGAQLVRSLCGADATGAMYVIAVTSAAHPARLVSSVLAAGCHDLLCAPFTDVELRARVDVHRRLRRWIASRPRVEPPTTAAFTDLRAWQYLGDLVADDLEASVGRPLEIEERWLELGEAAHLATISMTLPSEQCELNLSLVADAQARRWLGENLLGDRDAATDCLDDMMRELTNIAGGALKRGASCEGSVLTTGIPVSSSTMPGRGSSTRCWTIHLDDTARVGLVADVFRRTNRRVPARRLIEGMVVVSDIRNDAGVLLLPSGTRLTMTTAQRLSHLLDSAMVEILER